MLVDKISEPAIELSELSYNLNQELTHNLTGIIADFFLEIFDYLVDPQLFSPLFNNRFMFRLSCSFLYFIED